MLKSFIPFFSKTLCDAGILTTALNSVCQNL